MNQSTQAPRQLNCAIYTRKSSEEGLDQAFNSLDAQRESCEAYIASQRGEGWTLWPDRYDDGGFSGGTVERPALKALLKDIEAGIVRVVVVYKIDRLSRSILDFTQMINWFDEKGVQFAAVTQRVSTTDAAGRMNLNILMSFSQYEREIASERIRDKIAAAKRKGKYCGGPPILGYDVNPERNKIIVNATEAKAVGFAFRRYLSLGSVRGLARELNEQGYRTKLWITKKGAPHGGIAWDIPQIYRMLNNRTYIGDVVHKDKYFPGEHEPIIPRELWDQVQELMHRNATEKGKRPHERAVSFLRGTLRCGHCQCAMGITYTSKTPTRLYSYYICEKDTKRALSTCPVRRVAAGDIERVVLQQMGAIFRTPQLMNGVYQKMEKLRNIEVDRLCAQCDELSNSVAEQTEVLQLLLSGPGNKKLLIEQATQRIEQTNHQHKETAQRLMRMQHNHLDERSIVESFQHMDTFWKSLHIAEQQRVVDSLIESVEIREDGLDIIFKTPGMTSLIDDLSGIACALMQRTPA